MADVRPPTFCHWVESRGERLSEAKCKQTPTQRCEPRKLLLGDIGKRLSLRPMPDTCSVRANTCPCVLPPGSRVSAAPPPCRVSPAPRLPALLPLRRRGRLQPAFGNARPKPAWADMGRQAPDLAGSCCWEKGRRGKELGDSGGSTRPRRPRCFLRSARAVHRALLKLRGRRFPLCLCTFGAGHRLPNPRAGLRPAPGTIQRQTHLNFLFQEVFSQPQA